MLASAFTPSFLIVLKTTTLVAGTARQQNNNSHSCVLGHIISSLSQPLQQAYDLNTHIILIL